MAKLNLVCCDQQKLIDEYWHDCNDPQCYAQECGTCGAFETLCGVA